MYRKVELCQIAPFLYDSLKVLSDRVDRNSSNGVANSYGLDCSGIESQFWRDFPHPFSKTMGPTEPPVQGEVKRAGRGVNQLPYLAVR